jgi:hypothetical protein
MNFEIKKFNNEYNNLWDEFILNSNSPSFLYSRKYLAYHKNRFKDHSILIFNNDNLIAVFPAAISMVDKSQIISHPGLSYGGLVLKTKLFGITVFKLLEVIFMYFKSQGYKKINYYPIPFFYKKINYDDDIFFLISNFKAEVSSSNISSTIDLNSNIDISNRRKRALRKSYKNNLSICEDLNFLEIYWMLLTKNLRDRYKVDPVHSFAEISHLISLFPENIKFYSVFHNNNMISGTVLYLINNVVHTQYVASNSIGRDYFALDFLYNHLLDKYRSMEYRWFDFGKSNDIHYLNNSLYQFKNEFGAGSFTTNNYVVNL